MFLSLFQTTKNGGLPNNETTFLFLLQISQDETFDPWLGPPLPEAERTWTLGPSAALKNKESKFWGVELRIMQDGRNKYRWKGDKENHNANTVLVRRLQIQGTVKVIQGYPYQYFLVYTSLVYTSFLLGLSHTKFPKSYFKSIS